MLNYSTIPESFTGRSLYFIANHHWLNPPKIKEDFGIGSLPKGIIDKIARFTARLFLITGTGMISAPLGVLCNATYAHRYRAYAYKTNQKEEREKRMALAWEYLKASVTDLRGISCIFFASRYAWSIEENMELWFSSSKVFIPNSVSASSSHIEECLRTCALKLVERDQSPQKASGLKLFKVIGCQVYPYHQLKQFALDLRSITGCLLPMNHREVLAGVRVELWNTPLEDPPFFASVPRTNLRDFNFKNSKAFSYSVSWKSTAMVVSAIFVTLLIFASLYADYLTSYLGHTITSILKKNYAIAGIPFAILKLAKQLEIEQRDAEKDLANDLIRQGYFENSLAWYGKAALSGYAPAQRVYGLALLASLFKHSSIQTMSEKEIKIMYEALNWLSDAAINGDSEALMDLKLMIVNDLPDRCRFKINKRERLKSLFQEDFIGIAVNRFTGFFNLQYNTNLRQVFVNLQSVI